MRSCAKLGLVVVFFAMLACKQTEEGGGQAAPPAATSAPPAAASTVGQAQDVEVRAPRETLMKLIDSCEPVPAQAGLRLFGLRPDSLLGKAGFLNGDRVVELAGVAPGEPKERWDALRAANRVDVNLIRRGAPMKITLIVE